jgi:hypothetical protein
MFGLDVRALDVPAFLANARALYAVAGLVWIAALLRVRRAWWLLAGVLLANAYAWAVTNYPLQRIYALGPSHDRLWNVGLCQVVAAGNSPLQTAQVGQLHFEPFWGLLVAAVSGWNPDRVLTIYPFFPLVMACGFVVTLYYGLGAGRQPWSPWPRALAAGFATLLASSPLDFTGAYRVPWAMTFLLKPNHALGLVVFPLVVWGFVSIRGWWSRFGVGVLLHLLGWVFVLHMAYVVAGLFVFAAWSWIERRPEARRDSLDVSTVVLVNALVVSPYLYMLFAGYPFLSPVPGMAIPPWSPHLLETTTRQWWLFLLGAWGTIVMSRNGDRLGRVWASQVVGAYLLWAGYLMLSPLQLARERDEVFHWIRHLIAAAAGFGVWDLLARVSAGPLAVARVAAACLLALPWSFPYWWDPGRMDGYFAGSVPPLPALVTQPMSFLRHETDRRAVIAGEPTLAGYIAALGARRVLWAEGLHATRDRGERVALEEELIRASDDTAIRRAAQYGVEYLVVTPEALARHPGVALQDLDRRERLERVKLSGEPSREYVAVFRLRGTPPP